MKFSKHAQDNMLFFLNDAEHYIKKIGPHQQRRLDLLLGKLYKDIYNSNTFITSLLRRDLLKANVIPIHHRNDIPDSDLLNSTFVPRNVKDYIHEKSNYNIQYKCKIMNKNIEINIITGSHITPSKRRRFDKMARLMLVWLRMAFLYSPAVCGKSIKVLFFNTTLKKTLPQSLIDILGSEHCNSAVTTTCSQKGEIVIYRKEEWFKVFIHETFHALGLDFSSFPTNHLNYQMKNIFPIESKMNLFEAYSEFWATILNCLFCSYELLDDKLCESDFLLYCDFLLQFERIFSLFQSNKILYFMGMRYENLYKTEEVSFVARKYLYKEETNVFSYYIIKNILLYNYPAFLEWCDRHNINMLRFDKYDNNLNKFFEFVRRHYKNPAFLRDMRDMRDFLLRKRRKEAKHPLHETLRMTICELD